MSGGFPVMSSGTPPYEGSRGGSDPEYDCREARAAAIRRRGLGLYHVRHHVRHLVRSDRTATGDFKIVHPHAELDCGQPPSLRQTLEGVVPANCSRRSELRRISCRISSILSK